MESQAWKENEPQWKKQFQDLVIGEGRFNDLTRYSEFLGYHVPDDRDCFSVGKSIFQGEVHRFFPAEKEVLERDKCCIFDFHILTFETESKIFENFCKSLALNYYFPVIVDIHDILWKCKLKN
jgi:hypothetical protein